MIITPDSIVRLLKVNLEIDENNQIKFKSKQEQLDYFNSLPYIEQEKLQYIRKDNILYFPENIEKLYEYNYVMYKNTNYSDKWFFAYITDMKYNNDNMTEISIKTDSWQTWQFDITFKQSFIEREHVNDDTVGLHTVPENVELGDYTLYNTHSDYNGIGSCHVVMGSTVNPATGQNVAGDDYSGIYSGISYYVFTSIDYLNRAIKNLAELSKSDAITTLFIAPDNLTKFTKISWIITEGSGSGETISYGLIETGKDPVTLKDYEFTRPNNFNGYVPKNNKLLCFPYNFFNLTNNVGENGIYHYEDFSSANIKFKVYGSITPSCSIRAIPTNYKGTELWSEGISVGKFPQCSWNTDTYTNWLTQNGVNLGLGIAGSAISIGASAISGNPIGLASGILGVAQSIGSVYEHSLLPPTAEGNINNGDITYSKGKNTLSFLPIQIRREFAEIIDGWFSMYGYKVNKLKLPNLTGRRNWNFIKTINANIEAYIPQSDLQNIKEMFNKGITLWHNVNTFLDYSQNNDII